jgi:hypothetical protein
VQIIHLNPHPSDFQHNFSKVPYQALSTSMHSMIFLFKAPKHAFFFDAGVSGADGVTVRVPQGDDMGVAEALP